jgi:hypothetical protein
MSGELRIPDFVMGRRRLLALGGMGIVTTALVAACGEKEDDSGIARVGDAPTTTALPPADVNDAVLLRTASSIERSAIAVYDFVLGASGMVADEHVSLFERFRDDHRAHAETMEALTAEIGGEPWRCGNPRLDEVVFPPVVRAITGGEASETETAVAMSDDPQRDVLSFVHALETMAGATHQALVESLSLPALRKEAITIASNEVRHAALLAINITGRPDAYVTPAGVEAATGVTTTTIASTTTQDIAAQTTLEGQAPTPPATPIPTVYAIPGQFGSLAPTTLVVGAPNESGNRLSVNLETPSLNTFVYEYMTPECDV